MRWSLVCAGASRWVARLALALVFATAAVGVLLVLLVAVVIAVLALMPGTVGSTALPAHDPNKPPHDDKPRWSPDGTRIAFLRNEDGTLRVADAATGASRAVLDGLSPTDHFAWSPDGASIVATSRRDGVESPRCFGLYGCPELYVVSPADGAKRRVTDNRMHEILPTWSPDGRRIAFLAVREPDDTRVWRDVWVLELRDGTARRVTDDARVEQQLEWTEDGAELIVTRDDGSRLALLGAGGPRELPAAPAAGGPRAHRSSADGTLAFTSMRAGNGRTCWAESGATGCEPNAELYLRSPGGRARRITHTRVHEYGLTWSPDGRTLAFVSGGEIWLLDSSGARLRRLVD